MLRDMKLLFYVNPFYGWALVPVSQASFVDHGLWRQ